MKGRNEKAKNKEWKGEVQKQRIKKWNGETKSKKEELGGGK